MIGITSDRFKNSEKMDLIQIIQHQIMLNYMKVQSELLQTEILHTGKHLTG